MKIGVDCDSVLNNLTERVLEVYNADNEDNLTLDDITDYYMEQFVKPECRKDFYKIFSDKRVWKGIRVIDNCVDVLKKYNDRGHIIYIVTATEPSNMSKKGAWLSRLLPFLDIRKRLICIHSKQLLNGNIDVLIDDSLKNLIDGDYKRVVLDYPWNRNVNDVENKLIRCKDWLEIDKALEEIEKEKNKGSKDEE